MIELRNATRIFKSKKRTVKALDNVNVSFPEKGMVFVVGQSGAGKSTLLNIISLQDRLSEGQLLIDGMDVSSLSENQLATLRNTYFGIVFQESNLIDDFTVYENLSFTLELQGKTISREETMSLLSRVGIGEDILDEYPGNLSGGQAQRISFARAILKGSKVIICDEPTGSLDYDNARGVMDVLKKHSENGLVIVVSHDRALASEYADETVKIENGKSEGLPLAETTIGEDDRGIPELENSPKLPFRSKLFFAWHSFKGVIAKTIFAFVMVFATMACTMAGLTALVYDEQTDINRVFADNSFSFFSMRIKNPSGSFVSMSDDDYAEISDLFGGKAFKSLSVGGETGFYNCIYDAYNRGEEIGYVGYVTNFTDEQVEEFSFDYVGKMPEGEPNAAQEVMVSNLHAYAMGWLKEEEVHDHSAYQKALDQGKELYLPVDVQGEYGGIQGIVQEHLPFTVVGIHDSPSIDYLLHEPETVTESYLWLVDNAIRYSLIYDIFCSKSWQDYFNYTQNDWAQELSPAGSRFSTSDGNFFKTSEVTAIIEKNHGEGSTASFVGALDYAIMFTDNYLNSYRQIFAFGTGIFGIFFLFALFTFVQTAIERKKPAIKTLRSLGITKGSIYSIFSIQSWMMVLVSFVFALAIYIGFTIYMTGNVGPYIFLSPFGFNVLAVLIGLVFALGIATIFSVLFSMWAFRKKKLS